MWLYGEFGFLELGRCQHYSDLVYFPSTKFKIGFYSFLSWNLWPPYEGLHPLTIFIDWMLGKSWNLMSASIQYCCCLAYMSLTKSLCYSGRKCVCVYIYIHIYIYIYKTGWSFKMLFILRHWNSVLRTWHLGEASLLPVISMNCSSQLFRAPNGHFRYHSHGPLFICSLTCLVVCLVRKWKKSIILDFEKKCFSSIFSIF